MLRNSISKQIVDTFTCGCRKVRSRKSTAEPSLLPVHQLAVDESLLVGDDDVDRTHFLL